MEQSSTRLDVYMNALTLSHVGFRTSKRAAFSGRTGTNRAQDDDDDDDEHSPLEKRHRELQVNWVGRVEGVMAVITS